MQLLSCSTADVMQLLSCRAGAAGAAPSRCLCCCAVVLHQCTVQLSLCSCVVGAALVCEALAAQSCCQRSSHCAALIMPLCVCSAAVVVQWCFQRGQGSSAAPLCSLLRQELDPEEEVPLFFLPSGTQSRFLH
ncbi:hypothetical protein DUNSADRAFT_3506 [Dunaliella salina]|uniref:Uncharacterized protein n=1 Tax=Dunaliella salina TaxID=3046 RepID=A0ABQ7GTT3_DUNSA|nr:hypothetical protein DUNSADRAFT_3506 [Dunaliella salina]|eukprot:KAF5838019.1 hypothetical protein DUNSADRAFT_3506 [Dunaliella salina]